MDWEILTFDDVIWPEDLTTVYSGDANSPIKNGELQNLNKVKEIASDILEIRKRCPNSKTILLTHYDRKPKPEDSEEKKKTFEIANKIICDGFNKIGLNAEYVDCLYGEPVEEIFRSGQYDLYVLKNTRTDSQEVNPPENVFYIEYLEKLLLGCGGFVTFGAKEKIHRNDASVYKWSRVPVVASPRVCDTLKSLNYIKEQEIEIFKTSIVLGGGKPDDTIKIIQMAVEKPYVTDIFVVGTPLFVFLEALGYDIGSANQKVLNKKLGDKYESSLNRARKIILGPYKEKISLPENVTVLTPNGFQDVKIENIGNNEIIDIPPDDVKKFVDRREGRRILFNGSPGKYEMAKTTEENYGMRGTISLLQNACGYIYMFGEDTSTEIEEILAAYPNLRSSIIKSYTGGKALLIYLFGGIENCPALQMLRNSYLRKNQFVNLVCPSV